MKVATTVFFNVVFAIPAFAIDGQYRIDGTNVGTNQTYQGDAAVKKTGSTYSIVWQTGPSRQIGTGILNGSVLSVVFSAAGGGSPGVASFRISNDRIEGGDWTLLGSHAVGTERWSAQ